ncbi:MAG: histidinol-phosphate transaminase [Oscillospiraceae bacterium]|nr:histidinol-phosphate transaminase [Oscillospiraceae bacterium]
MSRFLSEATKKLTPYTPGEQPGDRKYIKLNTNESPYSPSLLVSRALAESSAEQLRLYPDMSAKALRRAASDVYGLPDDWIFAGGGSDEILGFAFKAFFENGGKALFPDISYGFYSVYADLFGLEKQKIPLAEDFTITPEDYFDAPGHILIANPNAPTGIVLAAPQIEAILRANPYRLVILDEAYIDFSPGASCVPLVKKYDNLLVVHTFSKSRALAGMRLGLGFGRPELIAGLERIKYSFNPYNIDHVSMAVGVAALSDREYLEKTTALIIKTRENTAQRLHSMGFEVLPSGANFLFARHENKPGGLLYNALRDRGILVRHWDLPRIKDFLRITIGTDKEMDALCAALADILC